MWSVTAACDNDVGVRNVGVRDVGVRDDHHRWYRNYNRLREHQWGIYNHR